MDVTSVSSSHATQATTSNEQVATEVHKKALEIQEQAAEELVESIPDPSSTVGQHIDVTV